MYDSTITAKQQQYNTLKTELKRRGSRPSHSALKMHDPDWIMCEVNFKASQYMEVQLSMPLQCRIFISHAHYFCCLKVQVEPSTLFWMCHIHCRLWVCMHRAHVLCSLKSIQHYSCTMLRAVCCRNMQSNVGQHKVN